MVDMLVAVLDIRIKEGPGQEICIDYPFKREEESMSTQIQKDQQNLSHTEQTPLKVFESAN